MPRIRAPKLVWKEVSILGIKAPSETETDQQKGKTLLLGMSYPPGWKEGQGAICHHIFDATSATGVLRGPSVPMKEAPSCSTYQILLDCLECRAEFSRWTENEQKEKKKLKNPTVIGELVLGNMTLINLFGHWWFLNTLGSEETQDALEQADESALLDIALVYGDENPTDFKEREWEIVWTHTKSEKTIQNLVSELKDHKVRNLPEYADLIDPDTQMVHWDAIQPIQYWYWKNFISPHKKSSKLPQPDLRAISDIFCLQFSIALLREPSIFCPKIPKFVMEQQASFLFIPPYIVNLCLKHREESQVDRVSLLFDEPETLAFASHIRRQPVILSKVLVILIPIPLSINTEIFFVASTRRNKMAIWYPFGKEKEQNPEQIEQFVWIFHAFVDIVREWNPETSSLDRLKRIAKTQSQNIARVVQQNPGVKFPKPLSQHQKQQLGFVQMFLAAQSVIGFGKVLSQVSKKNYVHRKVQINGQNMRLSRYMPPCDPRQQLSPWLITNVLIGLRDLKVDSIHRAYLDKGGKFPRKVIGGGYPKSSSSDSDDDTEHNTEIEDSEIEPDESKAGSKFSCRVNWPGPKDQTTGVYAINTLFQEEKIKNRQTDISPWFETGKTIDLKPQLGSGVEVLVLRTKISLSWIDWPERKGTSGTNLSGFLIRTRRHPKTTRSVPEKYTWRVVVPVCRDVDCKIYDWILLDKKRAPSSKSFLDTTKPLNQQPKFFPKDGVIYAIYGAPSPKCLQDKSNTYLIR
jgi:hypothetical protein